MARDVEPPERENLFVRFRRSIFSGPVIARTERERRLVVLHHLLLHLRPTQVPVASLNISRTFGLGGMSIVLLTLLGISGVLLMFAYEPSPDRAHDSLQLLEHDFLFGRLVRGVHYWSANLLVMMTVLHLLRVLFTGAFTGPRRFNWVIGLMLLFGALLSNFTGYLLPWDQRSYWAITICASMAGYIPLIGSLLQQLVQGGPDIGPVTLLNYYAIHTTINPVMLLVLLGFHVWRVRKARGIALPEAAREERVTYIPHLLVREVAVGALVVGVVLLLAICFAAPLGTPANPGMSPNPAKAPWYFMGFQELLLHFHSFFAVCAIPLVAVVGLVLIPFLRGDEEAVGTWFISTKGRRLAGMAALFALLMTPLAIVLDEFLFSRASWLGDAAWIRSGLLPVTILSSIVYVFALFIHRRLSATRNELVQTISVMLFVAFALLTITGIWWRGEGMALTWPGRQNDSVVETVSDVNPGDTP
jgi:quinol-cytochrome oxidoreductase complex cytochrome b subunit